MCYEKDRAVKRARSFLQNRIPKTLLTLLIPLKFVKPAASLFRLTLPDHRWKEQNSGCIAYLLYVPPVFSLPMHKSIIIMSKGVATRLRKTQATALRLRCCAITATRIYNPT